MTKPEIMPKEKREIAERNQTRPERHFVPDVDVREDEKALTFSVDMPGVSQDEVSVDLHEEVLTIQGEVGLEGYDGLSPVYTEYNVGSFLRRFSLPDGGRFEREKISARMADGVLEITLPKAEPARPRRIPVSA